MSTTSVSVGESTSLELLRSFWRSPYCTDYLRNILQENDDVAGQVIQLPDGVLLERLAVSVKLSDLVKGWNQESGTNHRILFHRHLKDGCSIGPSFQSAPEDRRYFSLPWDLLYVEVLSGSCTLRLVDEQGNPVEISLSARSFYQLEKDRLFRLVPSPEHFSICVATERDRDYPFPRHWKTGRLSEIDKRRLVATFQEFLQ